MGGKSDLYEIVAKSNVLIMLRPSFGTRSGLKMLLKVKLVVP